MQKITLQFDSVNLLWTFARTLNVTEFKISTKRICLTSNLNEAFISEALTYYKARIVKEKVEGDFDQQYS